MVLTVRDPSCYPSFGSCDEAVHGIGGTGPVPELWDVAGDGASWQSRPELRGGRRGLASCRQLCAHWARDQRDPQGAVVALLLSSIPGGIWAGFSAAGTMVLLCIHLRQCRPFHGLQSGLDQALHDCSPCAFQNCVSLYLDPNGGTWDELSSNNPWQEGRTELARIFVPLLVTWRKECTHHFNI